MRCRTMRAATPAICSARTSGCAARTSSRKPRKLMLAAPSTPAVLHRHRRMVDRAPAGRAQAARCRRACRPPIASRAKAPRRPRRTRASSRTSPPAGSRCASSTIRPPPTSISPRSRRRHASDHARARRLLAGPHGGGARPERRGTHALSSGAQYPTAYYGQIGARGSAAANCVCRPPEPSPDARATLVKLEVVRAVELLYAIDERDLVVSFAADLAERADRSGRAGGARRGRQRAINDARTMLLIGKGALARGLPFEAYAFPTVGLPHFRRSARRSTSAWSTRSRARKARSIRTRSRAPMRSA